MNRYLAIIVGLLFVLGLAAPSLATVVAKGDTKVTLSGSLRFRGMMEEVDFDSDSNPKSYYDARVRLKLSAKISKSVKAVVELESDSGDIDGQGGGTENWKWGQIQGSAQGVYKEGNTRPAQVMIRQAWLQYDPGVVGIKVGHMPLTLGSGIFFNHKKFGDDAIVLFADPNKQTHLAALTIKLNERSSGKSDDATAYVALASYKAGALTVGGDVTYLDDQPDATHLWNIGLRAKAKLGGVTIKGDVELQTGEIEDANIDFEGYAVVLGADFKVGKAKIGIEGGIGSGDDDPADDKEESFITTLGAHLNAPLKTFVYDYRVKSNCGKNVGLCNTTFAKLSAKGKATKRLGLSGQLVWLKATEDVNGEDQIGVELDGKVTYKLAKNLKYYVEGGYLFAGDFYGPDADDAWAIRHGIIVKF